MFTVNVSFVHSDERIFLEFARVPLIGETVYWNDKKYFVDDVAHIPRARGDKRECCAELTIEPVERWVRNDNLIAKENKELKKKLSGEGG